MVSSELSTNFLSHFLNICNIVQNVITFNTDNGVKVNNGVITARRAGEYTATITHKEDSTKQATIDFKIYLKSFGAPNNIYIFII